MSERKNIDRLFQEKFKDFEGNPSEDVWANIEAKLDQKKKRRIVPFWWKLSGVAAVFLLGFLVSKSIYDGGINTEDSIVKDSNSNKTEKTTTVDANKNELKNNDKIQIGNPVVTKVNPNKTKLKTTEENSKKEFNGNKLNSNETVTTTSNEEKNKTKKDIDIESLMNS